MTSGIAVGLRDHTRDYWHNGTCCSGYCHDGDILGHMFREFLKERSGWTEDRFRRYSGKQKLAVPEKLVWW